MTIKTLSDLRKKYHHEVTGELLRETLEFDEVKKSIKDIIKLIENDEWHCISCGRSTDYLDEFTIDDSVDKLIEIIKEKLGKELTE